MFEGASLTVPLSFGKYVPKREFRCLDKLSKSFGTRAQDGQNFEQPKWNRKQGGQRRPEDVATKDK